MQTMALPPMGTSPHTVTVPDGCFNSNDDSRPTETCHITARADYDAQVAETNEGNNSASGSCTRPATVGPLGIRRK